MVLGKTTVRGQRFALGRVVITRGALVHCEDNEINYYELIMRHADGDFGTVGMLDAAELTSEERELGALATDDGLKLNAVAIESQQGMVMSVYPDSDGSESKVWIQTLLADEETYTTILRPDEY